MGIPKELQAVIDAQIPVTASRRVVHRACSEGKDAALSVKRLAEGYVFNCFRCDYKGFIGYNKLPADQILKLVKDFSTKKVMEVDKIKLPEDNRWMFNQGNDGAPEHAYAWLWKAGITDRMLVQYEFGWSESYQRVIMPIRDDEGTMVGWVGRDPLYGTSRGSGAKYILRKQEGLNRRIYYTCHNTNSRKVVVVEDILSAVRVHEATKLETVALLNTHVSNELLHEYMGYDIVVWLDPGKLGEMVEVTARAQGYGINCKFISTEKDPKDYSPLEIGMQFVQTLNKED